MYISNTEQRTLRLIYVRLEMDKAELKCQRLLVTISLSRMLIKIFNLNLNLHKYMLTYVYT